MYDNQFRIKNDPILKSIQEIVEDGNIRSQAEHLVNEAFNVYSRKAVVLEDLAAYDAAVEEAYTMIKEDVQIDELRKVLGKYVNATKYDKEGDYHDPSSHNLAKAKLKGKKTYKDAFGGKHKVRVSASQKNEETEVDEEVMKQIAYRSDVARTTLKKQQPKKVRDNRFANPGALTSVPGLGSIAEEEKEDAPFKGGHNVASRFKREQDVEKQSHTAVKNSRKARYAKLSKLRKEDFEQLDEISPALAKRYLRKSEKASDKDIDFSNAKEYNRLGNRFGGQTIAKAKLGHIDAKARVMAKEDFEQDVFEELYININEQALLAIENDVLDQFLEGLTEEEFGFLDEEIVNEVVTQAQLDKSGLTLGQYLNKQRGLTARKGGPNDPNSPNFKGPKSGVSTPQTAKPSFDKSNTPLMATKDPSAVGMNQMSKANIVTSAPKPATPSFNKSNTPLMATKDPSAVGMNQMSKANVVTPNLAPKATPSFDKSNTPLMATKDPSAVGMNQMSKANVVTPGKDSSGAPASPPPSSSSQPGLLSKLGSAMGIKYNPGSSVKESIEESGGGLLGAVGLSEETENFNSVTVGGIAYKIV